MLRDAPGPSRPCRTTPTARREMRLQASAAILVAIGLGQPARDEKVVERPIRGQRHQEAQTSVSRSRPVLAIAARP